MGTPRKKSGETINVEDVFPSTQSQQLRTVTVPDPESQPVEYDDVTALNNVLSELGADEDGGGFVTVYREISDTSGKRPDEYLERYAASEFSLDGLKARWGAGKYKINVYHGGGAGLAARKVITIAKDPTTAVTAPVTAPATDLTPILQTMQQGFEKMFNAFVAMQQPVAPQPSRMDMLQEMQIMREMFAPAANQTAPASLDAVALLKLGAEMANNGGGGDSNNSWVGKIIDQLGPVLAPALAGAVQGAAQGAAAPRRVQLPPPIKQATIEHAAPAENQINREENSVSLIIAHYLNMLKTAAEKRAPVEEYADSILNTIPPSKVPDIENMLRPDDWRDKLRTMTNAADLHPEWFQALRDTLLSYIDEDKGVNLTGANPGVSVHSYEDDNPDTTAENSSNPASPA